MSDTEQMASDKPKRGFAALTPEQRRVLASKGGKAVQAQGKAPLFTSESGRRAGRKGGVRAHALGLAHAFTPEEAPLSLSHFLFPANAGSAAHGSFVPEPDPGGLSGRVGAGFGLTGFPLTVGWDGFGLTGRGGDGRCLTVIKFLIRSMLWLRVEFGASCARIQTHQPHCWLAVGASCCRSINCS